MSRTEEQPPHVGPAERQALEHQALDDPGGHVILDAEPDPPATAEEIAEIRAQGEVGEPWPDIYSAGDMKLWRARQAEYEWEAGA